MKSLDDNYRKKYQAELIVGIDEAGRGPLAGPVVAAAVLLDSSIKIPLVNDSKKLSKKKRIKAYHEITKKALKVGIGIVSNDVIDEINIYQASKLAMEKALANLDKDADLVITDYMKIDTNLKQVNLVKGDQKSLAVAAASIIAKVTRDNIMLEYDEIYPEYGFKSHKGYPTKLHLEKLETLGVLDIHRKSYKPVKRVILNNMKKT